MIENFRACIRGGRPFWNDLAYTNDPNEVSPAGAIKDSHHRLAAALLEGVILNFLGLAVVNIISEDNILFPSRAWKDITVDP